VAGTLQPVSGTNVNLPVGGVAYVVGNEMYQGPQAPSLSGSNITNMLMLQFDNECTKNGLTHGMHWNIQAPLASSAGASDTTLSLDPRFNYMFPVTPFVAFIRTWARWSSGLGSAPPAGTVQTATVDDASNFPDPAVAGQYAVYSKDEMLLVTAVSG